MPSKDDRRVVWFHNHAGGLTKLYAFERSIGIGNIVACLHKTPVRRLDAVFGFRRRQILCL